MKKLLLALPLLTACGNNGPIHITTSMAEECDKTALSLATNCSGPVANPTAAPTPLASTLTISGPVPAPSGSGWLTAGFVRVPGSTSFTGWQSLGLSTATSPVSKVYASSIATSGDCQHVDLKMITSTGAPAGLQGNFYNQGQAYRFVYCEDNGDIVVGYEDGANSDFADYKVKIHSSLGNLRYEVHGSNLSVCLD